MDNKLTPIMQAIKKIKQKEAFSGNTAAINAFTQVRGILETLLPAERQFAGECFEAGRDTMDTPGSPDFNTFINSYNQHLIK